jgi:hypothetical protein
MKTISKILLTAAVSAFSFSLTSCGEDKIASEAVAGTYSGTLKGDLIGEMNDVQIVITADGDNAAQLQLSDALMGVSVPTVKVSLTSKGDDKYALAGSVNLPGIEIMQQTLDAEVAIAGTVKDADKNTLTLTITVTPTTLPVSMEFTYDGTEVTK